MARRTSGEQKAANNNGRRALVAKVGRTVGSRLARQRESSSDGLTNGRAEALAEAHEQLHQQIAERAYTLYEQSGFQDGNDVEHWLEAERQIKGLYDQAA
jgi:Protein of unknown function (DUF2934)